MDYQILLYRKWSPMKRLEAAFQLYQLTKEIIRTREKHRKPFLIDKELEKKVRSFFR